MQDAVVNRRRNQAGQAFEDSLLSYPVVAHPLTAQTEDTYSLAQPPESIPAQKLIDIGFSLVDEAASGRKSPLLDRLREAQRTMVAQATLASLLTTGTPSAPGSQVPSI